MLLCFMLCNILRARTRSRTGNGMQINKFRNKHIYFVIFTERYKSPPQPALWAFSSAYFRMRVSKAYILWIGSEVLVPIKFYFLFLLNVKKANQKKTSCADNRDFHELWTSSCFHFLTTIRSKVFVAKPSTYSAYAFCLFCKHKRKNPGYMPAVLFCVN